MRRIPTQTKRIAVDILFDFVGSFICSTGLQCFSAPNNIAPGGVTGLGIIVNYLTGINLSALTFLINVPLLALAWFFLGRYFTINTLKSVVIFSITLEICGHLPVYEGEIMLAAIYGGVLSGIGLALVFMRGSTTGGTDIASRLIQLKFPGLSIGRLMLIVDGFILLIAAVVYRNVENALYGLITIFTTTRMIDSILYGLDTGKVMMVVSRQPEEIASAIITQLNRGCTFLQARGSYTKEDRPVLLCAVRKGEFHNLKRLVYSIDPGAFLLALEANEILGEGFKTPGIPSKKDFS